MRKELAPEWALLGLLTQKPMHGYELHRYFTDLSALGRVWYLGLSQMYKLLKELEKQGYLEVAVEEQENYPDRKVYHITPSGRAAFLQWMEKPVSNTRLIRVEFLAKLFLAQLLGAEMIERVISTQLEACQARLTRLREKVEDGGWGIENGEWRMEDGDGRGGSDGGFEYLVFRFREGQIQAVIDWLGYCRRVFLKKWRIENCSQAILLTGRRGVGKTTICQTVAELAHRRGYRPGGVITPAIYVCPEPALSKACPERSRRVEGPSRRDSHRIKVGFEAVDVGSGERWLLARTDRDLGGPRVGPYSLDPIALARALRVLQRVATANRLAGTGATVPCDLLMVDEIGPLELEQGEGFAPILDLLPVEGPMHTLIVIRPALLDRLLLRLKGIKCSSLLCRNIVFRVTEENRNKLPLQIVEELWGTDDRGRFEVRDS